MTLLLPEECLQLFFHDCVKLSYLRGGRERACIHPADCTNSVMVRVNRGGRRRTAEQFRVVSQLAVQTRKKGDVLEINLQAPKLLLGCLF